MADPITKHALTQFCADIFCATGAPRHVASVVAENLVYGDLRGVSSHGVVRVPIYVRRVQEGGVDPNAEVTVESDSGGTMLIDGRNNFGAYAGLSSLKLGIQKAKEHGVAAIGVKCSNHYGLGAYYVAEAIKHDCLLVAVSNAPQTMAPIGGMRPFLGTNPLTIGCPTESGAPFVLDMATSLVARGKVIMAAKKGEDIPLDWAIDKAGNPTRDPDDALAGSVLPMGGYKGFGLAMAIDILSGVLTGAGYGPNVNALYENLSTPQNVGHFFMIIDISRFAALDVFKSRIQNYVDLLKSEPRRNDVNELFYAGELEHKLEQSRLQDGIVLPAQVRDDLLKLGDHYRIATDAIA